MKSTIEKLPAAPVPLVLRLTLDLARSEAEALRALCDSVGGDTNGPRSLTQRIASLLSEVDIYYVPAFIGQRPPHYTRNAFFFSDCWPKTEETC